MKHNGKEIVIEYDAFPDGVRKLIKAYVAEDTDAYLIGIDTHNAAIVQRFALGHELAHVFLGHLDSSKPKAVQEREANKNAWKYYRLYRDTVQAM